jgi:hypothetical protein
MANSTLYTHKYSSLFAHTTEKKHHKSRVEKGLPKQTTHGTVESARGKTIIFVSNKKIEANKKNVRSD